MQNGRRMDRRPFEVWRRPPDREVIVLYGGFGPDGVPLSDTREWDGAWAWVAGC